MKNISSLPVLDDVALESVHGGRDKRRPGSFDTNDNWVPGRHNMNLDAADFGAHGRDPHDAEEHANRLATKFLEENRDYDLVVYDGRLGSGESISGSHSWLDVRRERGEAIQRDE